MEEKQEENIPQIAQEAHGLAILRLDLRLVRADDLFARMCYFLPKGGRIMFVAEYTTEKHGPVGLFDDEIDILAYVESRQRYYGVVECDSTDTAKFVYKDFITIFSYIGVTRKMLELRFIPDPMEFDAEKPTTYGVPDLVHLLSAKDLEQIGVVTQHRNPGRLSINKMEEIQEENIPQIAQEIHRLAILRLDLRLVRADDLFARMCYFLPKGGRIMFVAVCTTEKHGPVGLFDDEIDILASAESRQRYYGVVECDSTDMAKFVYKDFITIFSYVGVTRKMLELRFIPDSKEFDDHLLDVAAEFCRGTTIVGVQLKNAVGTYLATYGNNALIHRLREPVYILAACAGQSLWIYPIISHVAAMAKSKKWTPENRAVYTNMFLNSKYEPNRSIWDLPSEFNVKKTSWEMLFASSITKRTVEDEEYESHLWSGDWGL